MRDVVKIKNKNTGTYPIAFHLPGDQPRMNKIGHKLYKTVKNHIPMCDLTECDNVTLCFAVWGKPNSLKNRRLRSESTMMEDTLAKMGVPWFNIADGYEFSQKTGNYQKLIQRPRMLLESLSKIDTEYIMGWDIGDTFFAECPNKIVQRFESEFDCDMLFNAESNCFPNSALPLYEKWSEYDAVVGNSPYRYLNAGMWIARTDFYREISESVMEQEHLKEFALGGGASWCGTDQGLYHQVYIKNYPRIQIDHQCKIFQVICNIEDGVLEWEE